MTREKRSLDRNGKDDVGAPEEKRHKVPQLASVIVEALKVDSLQKLCSSLEPILRRVVSEEVERALAKLGPAKLGLRCAEASPKQIEGGDGRNLQLHFKTRLSLPLFTGGKVEGERGAAIHVVLLDATTGQVITSGPESSIKLEVTVLEGDFNNEDDDDWTQEEFESHEVREREGKRPLLTGDLQVGLKEGVGSLGDLMFTDNSSWIRSRKFRLGVKVAAGFCEGIRVREAKTESFTVKDHRGELYKKHYPPALHDEVWRLDKIGKDGAFHKKLNKAGIHTVEDFLRHVVREPQKLRNILGSGMSNKMWESTVEHAKTCVLSGKLYVYYADASRNVGVVFNNVYELQGLIANGQYLSAEALSDADKVHVDVLVKKAYDDWVSVVEYDGKALIGLKSNKKSSNICTETSIPALQYSAPYTQQPSLTESVAGHADQSSANAGLTLAAGGPSNVGFNDRSLTRYAQPSQQFQANSQLSYGNLTYSTSNQVAPGPPNHTSLLATDNVVGLALGPSPQQLPVVMSYQSMGTVIQQPGSSTNGAEDWSNSRDQRGPVDDYFSEEEIRSKSMEMLENEDMQNLLRMFTSGGVVNASDDGFHYPPFTPIPSFNYSDAGTRSSGKAVVGWLKLKAALRWGIFIRKIAAEKRAQIEELDD